MSTLATIVEESTSTSSKQIFCATFDFNTFSLNTELLSNDQLGYKKRHLSPNTTITKYSVQEYTNRLTHTTVIIINLSPKSLEKFMYAKIPSLNGTKAIYLHKLQCSNGEYYLHISFSHKYAPSKCTNVNINNLITDTKNIKTVKLLPLSFGGIALAIIYQQMPKSNDHIIDGILFHKHNAQIYKHFNRENKREAIRDECGIYKTNKQNIIKTLSHLRKVQKDAYKSINSTNNKRKRRKKAIKAGEGNKMLSLQRSHSRSVSNSSISSTSSVSTVTSCNSSLISVVDTPLTPLSEA